MYKNLVGLVLVAALFPLLTRAAEEKVDWRQKALELNRITGDNPADGQIEEMVKHAESARKLLTAAAELVKDAKKQPFNSTATYILARVGQDLKEFEISRTFYELQISQVEKLESPQKLAAANWGMIKLLIDNKKVEESQKVWQKYLEAGGEDEAARFRSRVERLMIVHMARQGYGDESLKVIEKKLKKEPKDWIALDLKARILREVGKLQEAIKAYEQIMEGVKKDDNLREELRDAVVDDCRYALSSVYVDLEQIDKASEQLKTLLDKKPDDPTFNNDLGFIWADHGMNLEESEKMIRKAIDQDRKQRRKENPDAKDNPSFLDSLGWVLFKQKKYKEAKDQLLKAVEQKEGQNIEIYDHLADCHLALGEKDDAMAAWKKGIEVTGTSPREQKRKATVEKKLKEHQK